MSLVDELKTVIALTGAKRIPHLEEEIFADEELTTLYLHNLCKELEWYAGNESNASLAYYYADYVIKGRWPEAEAIIAINSQYAYYYAADVVKGRWPEGEAVIKTDEDYWRWYCNSNRILDH